MADHLTSQPHSTEVDAPAVPSYRVAQDLSGDWWVWRRTSNTTWTTFRRCESEPEARAACDELNKR